jgi:hypothetical protein
MQWLTNRWFIGWLIDHLLFYVPLKNVSLHERWRHHCRWRPGKFRPMLSTFEQGGMFIGQHLLWNRTTVFSISSEEPPHSVAFYNTQGDAVDLFLPGSSRANHKAIPSFFFLFVKHQVRLLKPNYLSRKKKPKKTLKSRNENEPKLTPPGHWSDPELARGLSVAVVSSIKWIFAMIY